MHYCPAPGCDTPLAEPDPKHADYVANGLAVCSDVCRTAMYDPNQRTLPFPTVQETGLSSLAG